MSKKGKRNLKYGEAVDATLETIANEMIEVGRGLGLRPRLPLILGKIIKAVVKARKISRKKIRRAISDLEKRDLIKIEKRDDETLVYLEEKGEIKVAKYSLKLLFDFKRKRQKWDGSWFLVFFDVPEAQRTKRDYLREFLKELGFYQYQKSVYLFPYKCEKEVNFIKEIVEAGKYMKYAIAQRIEDEKKAKRFFNLT